MTAPSIFVCYRRSDEPFGAALTASMVGDLVGEDRVFIDTLYLRQRGRFEQELLAAVRGCRLVLAIAGPGWDSVENRARLARSTDWVRRELLEAERNGIRVVPVLIGRTDVPTPPFAVPFDVPLVLDRDDVERYERDLRRVVGGQPRLLERGEQVERAALAMLRHVLPSPQRSMANDATIARCLRSELGEGDWLRFVTTGNLRRRPNGSAVVYLTRGEIGIAQLAGDSSRSVARLPVADLVVHRTDYLRAWVRPMANLELTAEGRSIRIEGIFAAEADELLELIGR